MEENKEVEEIAEKLGYVDVILQKVISRKMFVFLVSILLLFLGRIDMQGWLLIASVYMGSQALLSAVEIIKGGSEK
jgi:hypothetical protein